MGGSRRAVAPVGPPVRRRALELVAFVGLATFATAHWAALVADPPLGRLLLSAVLATAAGLAAAATARRPRRPWGRLAGVAALAAAAFASALAAVGVPPGSLLPWNWHEVEDGVTRGLIGLRTLEWPYAGPDPWVGITILSAAPLLVAGAAALAFWPLRRGRSVFRAYALILLLTLYGSAVAQVETQRPLLQGLALLVLLAGWLLLPGLRRTAPVGAAALLALAAAGSMALAGRLPATEPLVDYQAWRPFGESAVFDWDHAYGPIDWPRRGETVFTVESPRPHYWRATTLDTFDGLRWVRAGTPTAFGLEDPPPRVERRWTAAVTVTVGALDSSLILSPGEIRGVSGVERWDGAPDGTGTAVEPLAPGESYTVDAYAPDPSVRRMRNASGLLPTAILPYTQVNLPEPGRTAIRSDPDALLEGAEAVGPYAFPPPGEAFPRTPGAVEAILESPYRGVYRMARRVAAGARTAATYDVVREIEAHLRSHYRYSEEPPLREYPLVSFLLEDRVGYCQQFSGAMALMLRLNGIPARVAAGFSPGSSGPGFQEFTVRDLDAHSWVEVYFTGVGWVPFDPTPPAAPAASRADGSFASAARGNAGQLGLELSAASIIAQSAADGVTGRPGSDVGGGSSASHAGSRGGAGSRPLLVPAALGLVAAGAAGGVAWRRRRRPRGDAAIDDLRVGLERLGHPVPPATTLAQLERRLEEAGHGAAARYVGQLREERYAAGRLRRGRRTRAELRRALTAGSGPTGRLRGLVAVPPGPPRPPARRFSGH